MPQGQLTLSEKDEARAAAVLEGDDDTDDDTPGERASRACVRRRRPRGHAARGAAPRAHRLWPHPPTARCAGAGVGYCPCAPDAATLAQIDGILGPKLAEFADKFAEAAERGSSVSVATSNGTKGAAGDGAATGDGSSSSRRRNARQRRAAPS